MRWIKRILFSIAMLLLTAVLLILVFISPVVEWAIEKYSPEVIGRQVQMEDLTINLLIGRLHIEQLEVFEANGSQDVWLRCKSIKGAINVPKLLTGKYELQYALVDGLDTYVFQQGNHFNFDDLLALPKKFSSKEKKQVEEDKEPVDWTVKYLFLSNSKLRYKSADYDIDYTASNINIRCPIIASDVDQMDFKYSFDINTGGHLKGAYSVNTNNLKYGLHFITQELNLSGTYPYVRDFIAINKLEGMLDSDLFLFGNHKNSADFSTNGLIGLYAINVVDTLNESIASIQRLDIKMDSIEVARSFYDFGDITLTTPYIKFERYKDGDNWTRLMRIAKADGQVSPEEAAYSNPFVIIAQYIREYIKEYVVSSYYADHIALRNGNVLFNDFTLHDKFTVQLDSMTMDIDRLNTDNDRLKMSFATLLNKTGDFDLQVAINPRDYQDMELDFELKEFNMSTINPYMIYYVANPFNSGVMHYKNRTTIESGILYADNKIDITQPTIGKKVRNSTAMNNLPVKAAVGMLKNPQGNIVLDIPVEGDLKDPEYRLGKTILTILKNLVIKGAEAPFKGVLSLVGDKEENISNIVISYGLKEFMPDQLRAINRMAKPLLINEDIEMIYTQWIDKQEEINTMITIDARKKYAEEMNLLSRKEKKNEINLYKRLLKISVNDSLFNQWLDSKIAKNGAIESPVEKCKRIVDVNAIKARQAEYEKAREVLLIRTLVSQGINKERITVISMGDKQFPPGDVPRFTYEVRLKKDE